MSAIELVGKIGSMALVDSEHNDLDYNKFARIGRELRAGMVWVSSGAAEIGRLDYLKRAGCELSGNPETAKTDYASQGQAILMKTYRDFIPSVYSVRQILVEHQHFNDAGKREHLRQMLQRCADQNAIPIINYNDAVSAEETRKMEIRATRLEKGSAVELVDNDETAAQIACLLGAKTLLILTSADGIYADPLDPSTLIERITAPTAAELLAEIEAKRDCCKGASRAGAGGARAKLEYVKQAAISGTRVIIANAKYPISSILDGRVRSTVIALA